MTHELVTHVPHFSTQFLAQQPNFAAERIVGSRYPLSDVLPERVDRVRRFGIHFDTARSNLTSSTADVDGATCASRADRVSRRCRLEPCEDNRLASGGMTDESKRSVACRRRPSSWQLIARPEPSGSGRQLRLAAP